MNKEERLHVVTLRIQGNKCNVIRQKFQRRFHKPGPTDKAIRELLRKFYATGSVLDAKRSGRPSTPDQSVELTRELFEEEPGMSLRRASDRLQIPRATIHKILKTTLRKKAYHIQISLRRFLYTVPLIKQKFLPIIFLCDPNFYANSNTNIATLLPHFRKRYKGIMLVSGSEEGALGGEVEKEKNKEEWFEEGN
ncbi:hypothetical protein C0J52_20346 [Blattella germanica]|nr:hypothetical protein C0J52_20346 [Blattella germanica]